MDKHSCVSKTTMHYEPDRPKAANPVKVQDLTFRDGHQSLFATRGRTEDMLNVAELMDQFFLLYGSLGGQPCRRCIVIWEKILGRIGF
jgi:hypothetical protein